MVWDLLIEGTVAAAIAAAALAVLALSRRGGAATTGDRATIAFLFEGDRLIDATRPARRLLAAAGPGGGLCQLTGLLAARFPDLATRLGTMDEAGSLRVPAADGQPGLIEAETWDGLLRLTLRGEGAAQAAALCDDLAASRLQDEVTTLRRLAEDSPQLMWREGRSGAPDWANRAYLDLARALHPGTGEVWPPQPVFADLPAPQGGSAEPVRQAVLVEGEDAPRWYEITSQCSDGRILRVAADVSEEVRARDLQRDLMQTLTKTFAGLSVGLAVFDRNRQLVLFNPALFDLTGIKPARLVTRPGIDAFLNMLREHRAVPDLRDFSAWRRQIRDLEGHDRTRADIVETWDLPDGRRFRVTLRPFPNRAIAMLIEDVSSDALLSRQLHEALQIGQEALDGVGEAICVFSAERELLLENATVARIWGPAPTTGDAPGLAAVLDHWRRQCQPSQGWESLSARLLTGRVGSGVELTAALRDGCRVELSARPTTSGGIILTCRPRLTQPRGLERITPPRATAAQAAGGG